MGRFHHSVWQGVLTLTVFFCMTGVARGFPEEPPLEQVVEVEPDVSLGVIFTFQDGSRFVHAKKGAVEYVESGPERLEVREDLNEVWYVTVDGALYTLAREAGFYYEPDTGRYESLIGKTWGPCHCGP